MASTAAAALLDELMGRNRNLTSSENSLELTWESDEVCKFYLVSYCPNELFTNTRADLGICDKVHDEEIKKNYQQSGRFEKMGYEEEFLKYLQDLLSDVERRIRRGHARLALNNTQGSTLAAASKDDKIQMLTERINELVEKAESLGCEGNVEEAQGVMKLCDQLKEEREQIEQNRSGSLPALKEMQVCDICGAFLVVGDAQQRIDEHITGKQHMGYAKVRATVESFKKKFGRETPEERQARMLREAEERDKEREREREERRKRQEEREKERERERAERKEREKRRRSRSRSRGNRSHRSRSRDRDRRRRSRSREHRRDRDRDRDGRRPSRERRRSRSKSRDRNRRDRSRDPDRARSQEVSRDKDRTSRDRDGRTETNRSSRERHSKSKEPEPAMEAAQAEVQESVPSNGDEAPATDAAPAEQAPEGDNGPMQGDSN